MKLKTYVCPYCQTTNKNIEYDEWDVKEPVCPHCNNSLPLGRDIMKRREFWDKFLFWSMGIILVSFFIVMFVLL